jgi:hypothetical protein
MKIILIILLLSIILQDLVISYRININNNHYKRISSPSLLLSKNEKQLELEKAMKNARENQKKGLSPGAGLATADEQSDAAYADLINTSMDQKGIDELEQNELEALQKGGEMWEKGVKDKGSKRFGLFSSLMDVAEALSGGGIYIYYNIIIMIIIISSSSSSLSL